MMFKYVKRNAVRHGLGSVFGFFEKHIYLDIMCIYCYNTHMFKKQKNGLRNERRPFLF